MSEGDGRNDLERIAALSQASVETRLTDSLQTYWADRFKLHVRDSYAGAPISKFPEDLRAYEHLLWAARPNAVIEIGTHLGGSALWFRDRLRTMAAYGLLSDYGVVTIDLEAEQARPHLDSADAGWHQTITLVTGDVLDSSLPARVAEMLPTSPRCLVVEDSAHTYATTAAALNGFAPFVPPGGFFVVEDGCVDVEAMRVKSMRLPSKGVGPLRRTRWREGVLPAISAWLAGPGGRDFAVRRDLELYGMTCHPGGFLQRRPE